MREVGLTDDKRGVAPAPRWLAQVWSRSSLRRKGLVVVGIPVLAIVLMMGLTAWGQYQERQAQFWVEHTLGVRAALWEVYSLVSEATSSVRGYLISGDEELIDAFDRTRDVLASELARIARMLEDQAEQRERLAQIDALLSTRLDQLEAQIAAYGSPQAEALFVQARPVLQELREALRVMIGVEDELLAERVARLDGVRAWQRLSSAAGVLLGIVGGVGAIVVLMGSIIGRIEQAGKHADMLSQGTPLLPVASKGDEIGQLERALYRASERLLSQGAQLEAALQGGGIAVWEYDPSTQVTRYQANPEFWGAVDFAAYHPKNSGEMRTLTLHPEDRAKLDRALATAVQTGEVPATEYRVRNARGDVRWFVARGRHHQMNGHSTLLGVVFDVTERKRGERALREREQQLRTLISGAPVILFAFDADGVFTVSEGRGLEALGLAPGQVVGASIFELYHDAPHILQTARQALTGEEVSALQQLAGRDYDVRYAPVRDADGEVSGVIGVATDVTERVRGEQALARQRSAFEKLAAFRQALIELVDESLRTGLDTHFFQRFLDRAVKVVPGAQAGSLLLRRADARYHFVAAVGYELEPLSRVSFAEHELERSPDRSLQVVRDFSTNQALDQERYEALASAGRLAEINVALSVPVFVEGEVEAYLNLDNFEHPEAFDASALEMARTFAGQIGVVLSRLRLENELKAKQEALLEANLELTQASRLKSEFLATMSHELRTPLTAVMGFSELLEEELFGPLNDKQKQYVHDIYESGQHLLSLINDILDLSKIEAGRLDLQLEPIEVKSVVQSALTVVKERAEKARVRLEQFLPETPPILLADARKLKQILYNLLANAVKFTPQGGRVALCVEQDAREVRFLVEDTGIGIAEEDIAKLFQEFSQLDTSLSRKHEGTGLGLALVKRLVELHGGHVWVTSEVGVGSTFGVALPLEGGGARTEPSDALPVITREDKLLALVVEDDARTAQLLQDYLEQDGYQVVSAADGLEGIAAVRAYRPDVVTLDIMMPVMSGWVFLEALANDPVIADTAVVIVTALGEVPKVVLGAHAVLAKPVNRQAFSKLVARAVRHQDETVLLVVADTVSAERLEEELSVLGCRAVLAQSGREALELVQSVTPDLLIVELNLPDMSGFDLLAQFRQAARLREVPLMVLTDQRLSPEERERLNGQLVSVLEAGAFSEDLFRAEVHRVTRWEDPS